jgi:hypothetical protein
MADDPRKSELIAELARARGELATRANAVRRETDVVARLKSSFKRHGVIWLAGAGVLGLLITRLPRRRKTAEPSWREPAPKTSAVKAGLLITALKVAFYIARPSLTRWLASTVADYAEGRSRRR